MAPVSATIKEKEKIPQKLEKILVICSIIKEAVHLE